MRDTHRRAGPRSVAAGLALLLAACGPGTGGTGLPPGDGADSSSVVSAPTPSTQAPSASRLPVAALPDRAPDLAGPIEAVDADTLTLAGVGLVRASVSLRDGNGAPLGAEAAQPGRAARAWRTGETWVVALDG